MSELHKRFLRRVRQHEQALGLAGLAEDEEGDTVAALPQFAPAPAVRGVAADETLQRYEDARKNTFAHHDVFVDAGGRRFQTYYAPPRTDAPVFVLHHGAGSSAMTFCKLAQSLQQHEAHPGVFAFDMRGHGHSDDAADYGLDELTADFGFVLATLVEKYAKNHSLYLVGHSLGGAVLTNYLQTHPDTAYSIKGLAMIDIVEETSVSSLAAMPTFLAKVPPTFTTYDAAINWHVRHIRLLNNYEAARLSVPDLLVVRDNKLHWKIDLRKTQPFWSTWFTGLSANFISCGAKQHVAKLLLLSGHESLDTSLLIGQMQGKYQLIVFNNANVGHFVHEDIPDKISMSLVEFARKNESPGEYMKHELGIVPKWGGKVHN